MDQSVEVWLPVSDYEGLYEVSNHGQVRSLPRVVDKSSGNQYTVAGRILRQVEKKPYGHKRVWLSKRGKLTTFYVHCLVAEAFLGPRPIGCYVCHGVGGVFDNSSSNLCYQSPVDNQLDRFRDDTHTTGERCSWAKLTEKQVTEIRKSVAEGVPQAELAKAHSVSRATICNIVKRKVWRHVAEAPIV